MIIVFTCAICKTEANFDHILSCLEMKQRGNIKVAKHKIEKPVIAYWVGELKIIKKLLTIPQAAEMFRLLAPIPLSTSHSKKYLLVDYGVIP